MKTLVWGGLLCCILIFMMYTVREGMDELTPLQVLKTIPSKNRTKISLKYVRDTPAPLRPELKLAVIRLLEENTSLLNEDMNISDAIKKLESPHAIDLPITD